MNALAVLGTWELIIAGIVALVVFGNQIPKVARNLGRAQKELQKGLAEGQAEVDGDTDS